MSILEFEKPIVELEGKIKELKEFSKSENINLNGEIQELTKRLESLKKEIYGNLTPWQKVQIARHPHRPFTLDYIEMIMEDFIELHGDRFYGDDRALIAGLACIEERRIVIIGHQKGHNTQENINRNFGCAHPEGYRKALRVMKLAEKFKLPIVSLIDTPGAYPGIGAEERGQALAIATNIREMFSLRVPIIVCIIGEGGSGGALGIGVGDRVLMLENAYYSVISPEGCAAILWKDSSQAPLAAQALKLTAQDLLKLGIIDEIVPEPLGGAHKAPQQAALNLKEAILKNLELVSAVDLDTLLNRRYQKFKNIGFFKDKEKGYDGESLLKTDNFRTFERRS